MFSGFTGRVDLATRGRQRDEMIKRARICFGSLLLGKRLTQVHPHRIDERSTRGQSVDMGQLARTTTRESHPIREKNNAIPTGSLEHYSFLPGVFDRPN